VPARFAPSDEVVLIAEDDEINRAVAIAMLSKQGRRTAVARDGAEAVEMALSEPFAAILMDCEMPGVDGYEATRQIRAGEGNGHVPIIAMTAYAEADGKERCLAAGMDDYLVKPLDAGRLGEVIEAWVGRSQVEDGPDESIESDEVVDEDTIAQLREALTSEMRAGLIVNFSTSLPRCMSSLEAARRRGDAAEMRRVARLLKGSATTLGASQLRAKCEALERAVGEGAAIEVGRLEELRAVGKSALAALRSRLR
jgi:two-component system, sensor histidine kinase and response regulator